MHELNKLDRSCIKKKELKSKNNSYLGYRIKFETQPWENTFERGKVQSIEVNVGYDKLYYEDKLHKVLNLWGDLTGNSKLTTFFISSGREIQENIILNSEWTFRGTIFLRKASGNLC